MWWLVANQRTLREQQRSWAENGARTCSPATIFRATILIPPPTTPPPPPQAALAGQNESQAREEVSAAISGRVWIILCAAMKASPSSTRVVAPQQQTCRKQGCFIFSSQASLLLPLHSPSPLANPAGAEGAGCGPAVGAGCDAVQPGQPGWWAGRGGAAAEAGRREEALISSAGQLAAQARRNKIEAAGSTWLPVVRPRVGQGSGRFALSRNACA